MRCGIRAQTYMLRYLTHRRLWYGCLARGYRTVSCSSKSRFQKMFIFCIPTFTSIWAFRCWYLTSSDFYKVSDDVLFGCLFTSIKLYTASVATFVWWCRTEPRTTVREHDTQCLSVNITLEYTNSASYLTIFQILKVYVLLKLTLITTAPST